MKYRCRTLQGISNQYKSWLLAFNVVVQACMKICWAGFGLLFIDTFQVRHFVAFVA